MLGYVNAALLVVLLGCGWLLTRARRGTVQVVHRIHGKAVSVLLFVLLLWLSAGQEQGPHPAAGMRQWYVGGYFDDALKVAASYYGEFPVAFWPIRELWRNPKEEAFALGVLAPSAFLWPQSSIIRNLLAVLITQMDG